MSTSMAVDLYFMDFDKIDRTEDQRYEPSAILIALEDQDDSEWHAIGYESRSQYIAAHLNGEI